MSFSLTDLNSKQRSAALFKDGPALILAGAGSGKTKTISYRIAHLILNERILPNHILGISFTNKASEELKSRVSSLVGEKHSPHLTICTFHKLALQILRREDSNHGAWIEKLGFRRNFTIYDQADQIATIKKALRQIRISDRKFDPMRILSLISRAKNEFLNPQEYINLWQGEKSKFPDEYEEICALAYPVYQSTLRDSNSLDFDDLIFNSILLLKKNPYFLKEIQAQYQYVIVDEYQDTNPAQFELLRLIVNSHKNLCVVGDDDQSIYGWRGADPKHLIHFEKYFNGASLFILEQNYRSTNTILKAANSVIKMNLSRKEKNLWSKKGEGEKISLFYTEDEHHEAEIIASKIKEYKKVISLRYDQTAILYRSNSQSRALEEALRTEKIPYKLIGGTQFFDRSEVRDLIAYLKLMINPKDDPSLRRILNVPHRGIGTGTIQKLDLYGIHNKAPFWKSLQSIQQIENIGSREKNSITNFVFTLNSLLSKRSYYNKPSDFLKELIKMTGYETHLQSTFASQPKVLTKKMQNVEELINGLAHFEEKPEFQKTKKSILREFIHQMTLSDKEEEEKTENQEKVTLMTYHSAKGLEFDTVFMVGVEEEILPHRNSLADQSGDISEERRLCYVGITRAKRKLIVTVPRTRFKYGKKQKREESRFLKEIPKELMEIEDLSLPLEGFSEKQREIAGNFLKSIYDELED